MSSEIVVNGIHYIAPKEAAPKVGLSADYVSRMCRDKLVDGKLVSGAWYVNETSLTKYLARQKEEEALRRASQAQLLKEERRLADRSARRAARLRRVPQVVLLATTVAMLLGTASLSLTTPIANSSPALGAVASAVPAPLRASLDRVATRVYNFVCPYFSDCSAHSTPVYATPGTASLSLTQHPATSVATAPASQQLPTRTTPTISQPTSPPAGGQPIIERVRETVHTIVQGGISEAVLDARLLALTNDLNSRMNQVALAGAYQTNRTYDVLATALRIENLDDVNITNSTWTSGSIAAAAISGTLSNAISSALATISSLTATELVATNATTTNATTTNLYVSGTATIGSGTGVLQSNSGVVSALTNGSNGQVLKVVGGSLAWSTDLTGGGGSSSAWATTTDDLALYPADTTQTLIIGASATTTTGNIFEVNGNSLLRGALTAYNTVTAPIFTATSSSATSTFPRLNISGSLGLGADYLTDFTGTGLTITSGALTLDTSGNWSGTLGGYNASQLITAGFSTTSADAWKRERNFFATSSADYWKTANNFFSTTSADFWETQQTTRSADDLTNNSIKDLNDVAAITENYGDLFYWNGAAWSDLATSSLGIALSDTTGTLGVARGGTGATNYSYGLILSPGGSSVLTNIATSSLGLLTTNVAEGSNLYYTDGRVQTYLDGVSKGFFFSTTSADYWKSVTDLFSTTSATYFVDASTTIPKTYTANTFGLLQTFGNASTSILSASTLCLSTDCRTSWPSAGSSFDYLFPGNATSTTLSFNGGLLSVGSTTIVGNATTTGMLGVGSLFINNSRFTSLLGTGLTNSGGALTLDATGDWTGTFDGLEGSAYLANSFSTTSADVWKSNRNFFASTSADYWRSQTDLFATTSSDFWLTQKTTDNLTQGASNKYYSTLLFASDLAGTTTGALAEGSNLYWTNARFDTRLAATTSLPNLTTLANLSLPATQLTNFGVPFYSFFSATNTNALAEGSNNKYFTDARADARINATSSIGTLTSAPNLSMIATSLSGFLKATAGVLSTALIDLANDVTGILAVTRGGTGWANIASAAIPYGNGAGALATTTAGTPGQILALLNGVPTWAATTTFASPLSYASGIVSLSTSGDWTGTLGGFTAPQIIAAGFSTTSAEHWVGTYDKGFFFSTTSADAWKLTRNFFSTTSTDYWETQQTARAADNLTDNSIEDLNDVAAITENYGDLFYWNGASWADIATSSLALNTTNLVEGSNLFFTDARVQSFIHSSTTIPKTYAGNTFTGAQSFTGGFTSSALTLTGLNGPVDARNGIVGATTSIGVLYGGTGLTSAPSYGSILVGQSNGTYALTATSSLGLPTFGYLFPSNATTTVLSFNGGLLSLASTTIGNGTQAGGLTISGGATTTGFLTVQGAATSTFSAGLSAFAINATGATSTLAGVRLTNTLNCSEALETNSLGDVVCGTDATATGAANDFTFATNYSVLSAATTSPIWAQNGIFASSTSHFVAFDASNGTITNASTTNISATYASSTAGFFGSLSVGNLTGFLKATAGAIASAAIDLASDVTGILGVARGGTGWANIASAAIPYGNGSSALATTTAGTPGQVLALLNGVPTWAATTTLSTITGTLSGTQLDGVFSSNGLLARTTTGTYASRTISGTSNQIAVANGDGVSGNPTLSLPTLLALTNASSSQQSIFDRLYVGGSATTTIRGDGIASTIPYASSTAFTAGNLFATNATTTSLAALGPASFANFANFFGSTAFGATGTTTIAANGTISAPSVIANSATLYSASVGTLTATSSFAVYSSASIGATGTSTFTSTGFLGIGTTTPGSALSIQGNIFLAGNLVSTSTVASIFPYASTTALTVSGAASTTNLIVSSAGGTAGCAQFSVTGLISNTGSACGSGSTAFPFTPTLNFGANTNATSTALSLFGGLNASSTIRFGNAGISGFLFDSATGNLGLGTTTPGTLLSLGNTGANTINISATATSTFGSGINIASGCFAVNGTCVGGSSGYVKRLAAIYATSTPGTNVSVVFGTGGPSFSAGTLTLPASTTEMVVEVWGGGGGGGGSGAGGPGGAGGTSCFGTNTTACTSPLLQATGGNGGTGEAGAGGAGGAGSLGDVNMTGQNGGNGGTGNDQLGGSAPRGGSGGKKATAGSNFGGGGGGNTAGGGGGSGYSMELIVSTSTALSSNTYRYTVGASGTAGSGSSPGAAGGSGGMVITIYATSSTNAIGNDYAEMFPVSNPGVTAGDIVAVDVGVPISMKLAQKGDKALAGVIATNPGQLLGDINAAGERPVALAGRVPVKFSNENGDVAIGDRIAPSRVPGVGMKAGPFDDSVGIVIDNVQPDGTVMLFLDLQRGLNINALALALLGNDASLFPANDNTASTSATSTPLDFVGGMMNAIGKRIASFTFFGTASSTATTTVATSTEATSTLGTADAYVTALMHSIFSSITQWLADASNGITNFFAGNIHAQNEFCVGDTCVTPEQFKMMVAAANAVPSSPSGGSAANDNNPPTDAASPADEPADPIEATASSTPPTSGEPPADQSSQPAPDVSTPLPGNDNAPAALVPVNDNASPPSAEVI